MVAHSDISKVMALPNKGWRSGARTKTKTSKSVHEQNARIFYGGKFIRLTAPQIPHFLKALIAISWGNTTVSLMAMMMRPRSFDGGEFNRLTRRTMGTI